MPVELPYSRKIAYACGMLGWSILNNIIAVMLIYFYLPPSNSGLNNLVTQTVIFGVFNAMALITAGSRLLDAVVDPFIAQFSDRSKNPGGRRIPLMKFFAFPAFIFCCLIFHPLENSESSRNIFWLIIMLIGFYISTTGYVIPYYALLPELAPNNQQKLQMSTQQSFAFVVGIIISSQTLNIANLLQDSFGFEERMKAIQYTVWMLSFLGLIFLFIPVFAINEKKYCRHHHSEVPLLPALRESLRNKNFLCFITADFSYFMAIAIITNGMLYYVTVLLGLEEKIGGPLMGTMVLVSLVFYPLINKFALRIGKKKLVVSSFAVMSVIFLSIFFLGKISVSPLTQIYMLAISFSLPLAILGILPNAIIAEIAERDSFQTGQNKEGMFFAVRFFFVKLGQTLGIALFALLTLYGKDPGNDLGIRLNGILGCVLCLLAGMLFLRFREEK